MSRDPGKEPYPLLYSVQVQSTYTFELYFITLKLELGERISCMYKIVERERKLTTLLGEGIG